MSGASWHECVELLERLPSLPTESRAAAIETLLRNPEPTLRENALRTGAAVISDERLEEMLREDADDVLRNAGLEMLKLRGARSLSLAIRLLHDEDPDVVLQAVLVLGYLRDPKALEPLRGALYHADVNVIQAAIEALGRLGDPRSLADLLPFLEADPWLQMATIEALGELRSPAAIEPLSATLTDLLCGELAADSIARCGGLLALQKLVDHWLQFREQLEPSRAVGWITQILEGLPHRAIEAEARRGVLLEELGAMLDAEDAEARVAAARGLLSIGPNPWDDRALEILLGSEIEAAVLPVCLAYRSDLADRLLDGNETSQGWAFRLLARAPTAVAVDRLARALVGIHWSESATRIAAPALARIREPALFDALIACYRNAKEDHRSVLASLLRTQIEGVERELRIEELDLSSEESWVLLARLRRPVEELYPALLELGDHAVRAAVLARVADYEELVRKVPWPEWLAADSGTWRLLAADVAGLYGLRELLPPLREALRLEARPELIRVVGELRDPESPAILIDHLVRGAGSLAPLILESLGQIGGPSSRATIRGWLDSEVVEARIVYRALSLCAVEEDDAVFRSAVGHSDWYVRLACVEVLGRFGRPENLAALSQLAADSVGVVAQRAVASLASLDPGTGWRSGRRLREPPAGGIDERTDP